MQERRSTKSAHDLAAGTHTASSPPSVPTLTAAFPAAGGGELLSALLAGMHLGVAVPTALALVERDPLATCGRFRGDTLRGLMEVPGGFWARNPRWYARYVQAIRAGAGARRRMPDHERMEFWNVLE